MALYALVLLPVSEVGRQSAHGLFTLHDAYSLLPVDTLYAPGSAEDH